MFPVIQEILTEDVQEFVPYVFQILSLLLEYHNPGNITGPYMELFQFLLIPVLWERPGNIKPLVRLIQAYIRIGAAQVIFIFMIFLFLSTTQYLTHFLKNIVLKCVQAMVRLYRKDNILPEMKISEKYASGP